MQGTGRIAAQINTEHISVGIGRYSFPTNYAPPNLGARSADTVDNRQSDYERDDHSLSTLSQTIDQSCSYVNRPRTVSFSFLSEKQKSLFSFFFPLFT